MDAALLVLFECSQSVKDQLFSASLSESECKGTTFFRNGKTFHEVFLRKERKNFLKGSCKGEKSPNEHKEAGE